MSRLAVLSLISLFVLPVRQGMADDFRVIPNAAIRQEYNDNIFFSDYAEQDDFITTASAGLEVRERTELLKAVLVTRLDGLSYADNSELNAIEEYYKGSVGYQLNPFLNLTADAGYSVDSRSDRDLDVTGYVLTTDVRRRQDYSFSADYRASEKTSLFSSYSYLDDQFETSEVDEFTGRMFLSA